MLSEQPVHSLVYLRRRVWWREGKRMEREGEREREGGKTEEREREGRGKYYKSLLAIHQHSVLLLQPFLLLFTRK